MSKDQLVGTWKLVSYKIQRFDGTVAYPLGEGAVGRLAYNNLGEMALQMMKPDRSLFVAGDRLKATSEEIREAFLGYIAYWGTYDVDAEEKTVTHYPEGVMAPNAVGVPQVRFYELIENRLIYREPLPIGNGYLTWERME